MSLIAISERNWNENAAIIMKLTDILSDGIENNSELELEFYIYFWFVLYSFYCLKKIYPQLIPINT